MKILIAYATTEGQTRKITRFAADHLSDAGHAVELLNVTDAEGLNPGRFDRAILAGSVHAGQMQDDLISFARTHGRRLSVIPTLYLQVSLAAAGADPKERADLEAIAARLATDIGWTPTRTEHIAGAFRFSQYDFFKSWAMRWIAHQKGQTVDPYSDREYTDWDGLRDILDSWAAA